MAPPRRPILRQTALHKDFISHAGPLLSSGSVCGSPGPVTWCMPAMVASTTGQRGAPTWHSPRAPATVMALVVKLLASEVPPTRAPAARAAAPSTVSVGDARRVTASHSTWLQ